MSIVKQLTLTSLVAQVLQLSLVDTNNNNQVIPGKLSNIVVTSADPATATAVPDTTDPISVDVDAVTQTGSTTVTATADFVSDKLQADGVTPVVSGNFTATLAIVNNVAVVAALAFNQN